MEGTTATYASVAGSSSLPWLLGTVGLILILLFAVHRGLIRSSVLTRVGPGASDQIIQNLLFIGLLLGVLLIPLALALEFAKTREPRWDHVTVYALSLLPFLLVAWWFRPASPYRTVADPTQTPERHPARLACYLANRTEQEAALDAALVAWLDERRRAPAATAPFVCITHGRECEHARFLDRMHKHFFLGRLPASADADLLKPRFGRAVAGPADLKGALSAELKNLGFADKAQEPKRPLIVGVELMEDDWFEQGGDNPVTCFVRHWQELAAIHPPATPVIAFLCIRRIGDAAAARRVVEWFNGLGGQPDGRLDADEFHARFGLPGLVLPELRPVVQHDVVRWAECHAGLHRNEEGLKQRIEELFRDHNGDPIPMRTLGLWLNDQLAEENP